MRRIDLVTGAYERCAPAWAKATAELRGLVWVAPELDEEALECAGMAAVVAQCAEEALGCALGGDYHRAARQAEAMARLAGEVLDFRVWDRVCERLVTVPTWEPFAEACGLAERVDSFLATLETAGQGKQLARGCRDDLDGLLVLADWCEEAGRPGAAAEARHMHRLVRLLE